MATIEKLSLCGLRSFGPYEDDMQTVKFASPLTLFLGENGCGKTTVIESLKFACSGEVPGGSKSGQGFVNDPKLSGKASTKGQVRLRVSDAKGNKYIIVKSVQVVNKGATSSFKRLDTTLKKINPDGTESAISSRCGDIDTEICEILGVSKAILNNVIFCHQENAAWPLDEPKKLKEKFDEIFGATEYNKCSDNIRKIIKERESENKTQFVRVGALKQTKDIVDKKRSEKQEKEEKLTKFQEVIQEKDRNIEPIIKRLEEIANLETNLAQLQTSCTKKETTKAAIVEQQKSILKTLVTEYTGSDQDLRSELASFEANRGKIEEKLKTLEGQKKGLETEHKQLSNSIDRAQIKLGKLQELKKQHQNTTEERNNLIQTAAGNLGVQVAADLSSNEDVTVAINAVQEAIESSKTSLQNLTEECDSEETLLQGTVNAWREKLAKTKQNIDSKNQQIHELKSKHRNIQSQLRELDYSDEQLKSLETKIKRIDDDLQHLKSSFDVDAVTKSIDTDKQKVHRQEEKMDTLERERKILQQNRVTEAELETQRHEVVKRESEILKLKNKHYDNFNKIFGDEVPNPGFIKTAVENLKQTNTTKINDLNRKIGTKQKEVTTLETKLRFQREKLQSLEKELQQNERQVFELCKGKPFDKECSDLEKLIEKLQKNKGQYSSAKIMYEKFLQDFQSDKPCCPICQTGFNNQQAAIDEIVRTIRNKIQGIPQQLQKVEEDLKQKQQLYNKLLQLKPINDKIEELKSTLIPKLVTDNAELDTLHKRVNTEFNELNDQLEKPQKILDICNKLVGDSALIDQNNFEITRSQRKINELESQLTQVPSNRSLQQAEAEIEDTKMDITNARRNYETSQRKLQQHNERCQGLREQRSKHVEKQLQLQKAMQGKPQLQEQLVELSQKEESLEAEIGELKTQLNPIKTELADAEKVKEATKQNNRKKLNEAQNEFHRNQKLFDDIKKLQRNIESYIAAGKETTFETAAIELNKLKTKEESIEENKREITNSITDVNKQLANQDGGLRTLQDNLSLREKRKEQETLSEEIADLKRQIGDYNYKTIHQEKQRLRQEEDDLRQEINQCKGRNDELEQQIKKLTSELNSTDFRQAHTKYKRALMQYSIAKEAVSNLQLYVKALEHGVLIFHQERMNQINKIIRQLWRSIYKGNDCDYIEIKTDETKTTGVRRTYNYKVVQMKSNVEIEMRGRCSAGQKVLACLVIRMALAETFSKNCGILALDEPTTNLDRSNITSLSEALARIVNSRQAEKNFQLLVITHDEEFLAALSRVDKVSYFWRVSRNNRGNSLISRETI